MTTEPTTDAALVSIPAEVPRAVLVVIPPRLRGEFAAMATNIDRWRDTMEPDYLHRSDDIRTSIGDDLVDLVAAALDQAEPSDNPLATVAAFADYMARLDASDDTYIELSDVDGYLPTVAADVHRLTMELAEARERLTSLFPHEVGDALVEHAGRFTCTEADALVDTAKVAGCGEWADTFLRAHQDDPEHDL